MMSSSAGEIIYKAFAPNLKIWICISIGYAITKKGLFPPTSARGVSTLSLNVGLPCLVFSSMVTAFSPSNGSAIGALAAMAICYQLIGLGCAWILREVFYVPQDFRWGILVLGMISNWGNMPIAIVQTLGLSSPFDGKSDVELGVAYSSVFILIMNTVLFPCGMHKLCALDFKEEHLARPIPPTLIQRLVAKSKRRNLAGAPVDVEKTGHELPIVTSIADDTQDLYKSSSSGLTDQEEHGEDPSELHQRPARPRRYTGGVLPTRKTSRASSISSMLESTRPIPPTAPLDATDLTVPCQLIPSRQSNVAEIAEASLPTATNDNVLAKTCSQHGASYTYHHPATPPPSIHKPSTVQKIIKFAKGFIMPVTMAIVVAVPCSVILPLKALFTNVDGWTGTRIPNAPNGDPPLSFILDTTTFLGGMSVPTSLILLGASFARLKAPEKWSSLPIAAVTGMACVKMILIPIFSVFVVSNLRSHSTLFPKDDRMRAFVAIITSGTPAAINQLVVTQLYNPAGTAHSLATFLSLQYLVMPVLTTAIAAIALYIVE